MTGPVSLGGSLASTGWTMQAYEDGTSVAGFTVLGTGCTWGSGGSEIQPVDVDGTLSAAVVTGAGDPLANLNVIEVEMLVGSTSGDPLAGVALLYSDSSAPTPGNIGAYVRAARSSIAPYNTVAVVDQGADAWETVVPYTDWVTLRLEMAFGVGRAMLDGEPLVSLPVVGPAIYPALICQFSTASSPPMFRNLRAWSANPGPFT